MLANKDLYAEIENIDNTDLTNDVEFKKSVLKVGTLALKLLHNIRANSVALMKHAGVDLIKPVKREEETTED